MSQIIWYGAGKNLQDFEKEFVAETGYPLCICDASVEKQGTVYTFDGGHECKIASLVEVKQEYPDYELWLTLAKQNILDVYDYLKKEGIPRERIRFFVDRKLQGIQSSEVTTQDGHQYNPHSKLYFEVHLVEHCNLNCIACGHFSSVAPKEFLDPIEYEADCQRLSELFDGDIYRVYLTGGETLLHPQVTEFVRITRTYFPNARICIFTNGILIPSMGATFWEAVREHGVEIISSEYPNINYERVAECCAANNTRYEGVRPEANINTRYFLDENGDGDSELNFFSCYQANFCVTLKHGRMYPCVVAAHSPILKNHYNVDITLSDEDGVDIYSVQDGDELLKRLTKPMPFCRYCNTKASELYCDDWRISSGNPYEWLAFNWCERDFDWLRTHNNIYVFGDERWGCDAVMRLQKEGIQITAFLASDSEKVPALKGVELVRISDFECAQADDVCIIAVEDESRKEIQHVLYEKGFSNLVPIIREIQL